jgi:SAM-dependent methyltransferase
MRLERLRYVGWGVECPLCGGRFRSFAPDVWDGRRWHGQSVRCPACDSLPRHRFLWLFLTGEATPSGGESVLHLAPEPIIGARLEAIVGDYTSSDLDARRAAVQADVTALPFPDRRFDLVLCSHVLEHVPADRAAMGELFRVLRPGGTAIVQTPVNYDQAETYEDASALDPEERLRRFSQSDHVRVYGRDLRDRLTEAGFDVAVKDAASLGEQTVERYCLRANADPLRNDLYLCGRAS